MTHNKQKVHHLTKISYKGHTLILLGIEASNVAISFGGSKYGFIWFL